MTLAGLASQFCTELGPAQPQIVSPYYCYLKIIKSCIHVFPIIGDIIPHILFDLLLSSHTVLSQYQSPILFSIHLQEGQGRFWNYNVSQHAFFSIFLLHIVIFVCLKKNSNRHSSLSFKSTLCNG